MKPLTVVAMRPCKTVLLFLLVLLSLPGYSQDSALYAKLYSLPDKLFNRIGKEADGLERKLDKQTERYLAKLAKQEHRMQRKLWRKDSVAAKALFGNVSERYSKLQQSSGASSQVFSSHLDSVQTAMRFLRQLSSSNNKYLSALNSYSQLQDKLNQTAQIKKYLKDRQQYLKTQLQQLGFAKELKKFQKDVYYYRAQVDEYKRMLDDPAKLTENLLQLANKIPAFKDFFAKHSMLASMFRVPGNDQAASAASIAGLQTRASVQQNMLQRFGSGPDVSNAMQQNIQSAQAQINQLKEKITNLGGGSSDMDMPDFKPNSQKTKSFWNRLELGTNIQSAKGNNFFPVTSDIALSAGYKLNDKSVAGIGLSYKLGWGENIRHINLTHEGIGLRSFLDIKLKGSFYASGGFEYNYQKPFNSLTQLYGIDHWQQSGLVGVSKVVAMKSKLFKKTKVQLLWDFLSYQQVPRSQPLKFRIGYTF